MFSQLAAHPGKTLCTIYEQVVKGQACPFAALGRTAPGVEPEHIPHVGVGHQPRGHRCPETRRGPRHRHRQPAPGAAPSPGPMKVEDAKLRSMLGVASINFRQNEQRLAIIDTPLQG